MLPTSVNPTKDAITRATAAGRRNFILVSHDNDWRKHEGQHSRESERREHLASVNKRNNDNRVGDETCCIAACRGFWGMGGRRLECESGAGRALHGARCGVQQTLNKECLFLIKAQGQVDGPLHRLACLKGADSLGSGLGAGPFLWVR
jgi:hypothetical protein